MKFPTPDFWVTPFLILLIVIGMAVVLTIDDIKLDEEINGLKSRIVGKTPEGWHRSDMDEWCEAASRANKGFECPNPRTLPRYLGMIESE